MIFRQLFEPESATYSYLLGCPDRRKAVLIDPVMESLERDLAILQELSSNSLTRSRRIFTPIMLLPLARCAA